MILTELQKRLLKAIGVSHLGKDYVWTGGTALAYRLKHRFSEDLDFFATELMPEEIFLAQFRAILRQNNLTEKSYEERMNRRLFIMRSGEETIKMEFVYFPFAPVKKPVKDRSLKVRIDSVGEIAVNKVLSAFQRKEPKDAYDLYVLLRRKKFDLKKLIVGAEKKFGVKIDEASLSAKLLASAKNIDALKPFLLHKEKNLAEKMQDLFQKKGNSYLNLALF